MIAGTLAVLLLTHHRVDVTLPWKITFNRGIYVNRYLNTYLAVKKIQQFSINAIYSLQQYLLRYNLEQRIKLLAAHDSRGLKQ